MYKVPCPPRISTTQSLGTSAGSEWTPMTDTMNSPSILSGVSLFQGNPGGRAELKPDNADTDEPFTIWGFGGAGVNNLWIACKYANTHVYLAQALPPLVRSCKVTYDATVKVAGNAEIKDITCHHTPSRDDVKPGLQVPDRD